MSAPEHAASGPSLGAVVYFSSASENTARFIAACRLQDEGINVYRIPLRPTDPALDVREPYILMVPTYGGGVARKAVPVQVKRFLNDPGNRKHIRGVIASGNTNFGEAFCMAGDIVAAKCKVPFLYYFELMGTREDVLKVRKGVLDFFTTMVNNPASAEESATDTASDDATSSDTDNTTAVWTADDPASNRPQEGLPPGLRKTDGASQGTGTGRDTGTPGVSTA